MRTRLALVAAAAVAVLPAGAASATTSDPVWAAPPPVPLPEGANQTVLQDVTVVSPDDVWAVGAWNDKEWHALAVHWDGSSWARATLPADTAYQLTGVSGVGPNEVWAVGSGDTAVILRFDGTGWTPQPLPSTLDGPDDFVSDVDMVDENDGWAIGQAVDAGVPRPVVLRWQLGRWAEVALPVVPLDTTLTSVSAVAKDDIWLSGTQTLPDGRHGAVILHWKSGAWAPVDVIPLGKSISETLVSIGGTSSGEVWAVGSMCDTSGLTKCQPLVLRRTVLGWVTLPANATEAELTEVVVFPSGQVWLIGHVPNAVVPQIDHAEYWTGLRFVTDETLPANLPPDTTQGQGKPASALSLAAAAVDKVGNSMWAVGWSDSPNRQPHAMMRS